MPKPISRFLGKWSVTNLQQASSRVVSAWKGVSDLFSFDMELGDNLLANVTAMWHEKLASFHCSRSIEKREPLRISIFWNLPTLYFISLQVLLFVKIKKAKIYVYCILGIKIRNLKIDFNTRGSQHRVKQWTLIMMIYDNMISLSRLVAKHVQSCNLWEDGIFFQLWT